MTDLNFIHLEAKDIKKAIEALKKNGVGQNGFQVVLDANKVYQIMLENERLRRKPDPDTGLIKCGYCNGTEKPLFHENKYEPYESMQSWITISESKESKRHLIEVDLWDGANTYAAFEINYCPMCGRKLEESK